MPHRCRPTQRPSLPAVPVAKAPEDPVVGGTVNAGGPLRVQVTRVGADTALAQIVRLVETAQVRGWSAGGWVPESDSACFVGTGLPFFCPCLSSECSKVIAAICLPCHAFHADEQGTHPSLCRPRVRCVCARHRGTGAPDLGGVVSASAGHLLAAHWLASFLLGSLGMRIAGGTAASARMPALPMPTACKMHSVVLPPQVRRWRAGLVPRLVAAARPQPLFVCPAVWHHRPRHRLPLRPGPGNPHSSHGWHRWADLFSGAGSLECQR